MLQITVNRKKKKNLQCNTKYTIAIQFVNFEFETRKIQ